MRNWIRAKQGKTSLIFLHTDVRRLSPPFLRRLICKWTELFSQDPVWFRTLILFFPFACLGSVRGQLSVILCKLHSYPKAAFERKWKSKVCYGCRSVWLWSLPYASQTRWVKWEHTRSFSCKSCWCTVQTWKIQLTNVQLNFSPALYLSSFGSLKQMNCIKLTVLASTGKSIEQIV